MDADAYRRILVPTDLSELSARALRYAAMLQERFGSTLTLLYADEAYLPMDLMEAPIGYYLEQAPQTKERIARRLEELAATSLPGIPVEQLVLQDAPVRAIAQTVKSRDIDLVVMGTHGRRGWRRALLGSVTESALHEIDRPLITVTPLVPDPPAIRQVVCPVNFTYVAREALQHAARIAAAFDAELTVVYVPEGVQTPQLPEVEAAFSLWVEPATRSRVRYRLSLAKEGEPAEAILETIADSGADLVVIGAQHRFFSDATTLGTTTQRLTRFARCPVMTVIRRARAEIDIEVDSPVDELARI